MVSQRISRSFTEDSPQLHATLGRALRPRRKCLDCLKRLKSSGACRGHPCRKGAKAQRLVHILCSRWSSPEFPSPNVFQIPICTLGDPQGLKAKKPWGLSPKGESALVFPQGSILSCTLGDPQGFSAENPWGPTFFGGFCCHEPWGRAGDGAAVKTPATYISANPPARTVLACCTHSTATPQVYFAGTGRDGRPRCSVAAVPKGGGFTLGDCHPKSNIPHERGCSSCSPAAQKPQSCRAW